MLRSRLAYYAASIPHLLRGFQNWPRLVALFVGSAPAEPVTLRLRNGLRFKARSFMDAWIIKETCIENQYQRAGLPLEDGWTVVDIGAGLGDFAISVARQHPRSTVYAYEPFPESFALLQTNLDLNAIDNVCAIPHAVGAEAGTMTLRFVGEAVQHTTASAAPGEYAVEVPSTTLVQLFARHQIAPCDYLKMDCEGAEYAILLNSDPATLHTIRHLCLEYHDGVVASNHSDLVAFLQRHGFQTRLTPNPVHGDLGYLYAARETLERSNG